MLFFAAPAAPEPSGLILTIAEAARERARRRFAAEAARSVIARARLRR